MLVDQNHENARVVAYIVFLHFTKSLKLKDAVYGFLISPCSG